MTVETQQWTPQDVIARSDETGDYATGALLIASAPKGAVDSESIEWLAQHAPRIAADAEGADGAVTSLSEQLSVATARRDYLKGTLSIVAYALKDVHGVRKAGELAKEWSLPAAEISRLVKVGKATVLLSMAAGHAPRAELANEIRPVLYGDSSTSVPAKAFDRALASQVKSLEGKAKKAGQADLDGVVTRVRSHARKISKSQQRTPDQVEADSKAAAQTVTDQRADAQTENGHDDDPIVMIPRQAYALAQLLASVTPKSGKVKAVPPRDGVIAGEPDMSGREAVMALAAALDTYMVRAGLVEAKAKA